VSPAVHPLFPGEGPTVDGYATAKVPLRSIKFLDRKAVVAKTLGREAERYARYCEYIYNGHYANGLPIVYRTPDGVLIASDLRHSDIILYGEKTVKRHPSVPRNPIDPKIDVKIIDVDGVDDIARARAHYMGDWA